jgi:hypothetical protein
MCSSRDALLPQCAVPLIREFDDEERVIRDFRDVLDPRFMTSTI